MSVDIRVISLTKAVERRAHIAAQAERLGLSYRIVDAVNGYTLSPEEIAAAGFTLDPAVTRSKPMTAGEIACYMSHILAMTQFLQGDADWCLVCEDDVVFAEDLPDILAGIDRLPLAAWQLIKLGGLKPNHPTRVGGLTAARALHRPLRMTVGAHCYAITRSGAKALVRRRHIEDVYDFMLDRYWIHGLNMLEVAPWPTHQSGDLASDIAVLSAEGRWENKLPQWKKSWMSVRRKAVFAWRRLRDRSLFRNALT